MFLDGAAAWLSWQYYPTGRMLTLNNAQTFFQQLKQKYFIFACDNGNDQILFYTGFTHVSAPQYQVTGYRFDVDYNVDHRRQYILRDENETMHKTIPSFAQSSALTGLVQAVMGMCDLGAGVVLAGNYKNAGGAGKIYRSTDYGLTWDSGYATGYAGIYSLLSLGSGIVLAVGYYGGPDLRSTDYGVSWIELQHIGNDTTFALCDCGNGIVLCGHNVPGGNPCEVWRSTDYGATWAQAQQLGTQTQINAILYVGSGVCVSATGSASAGKIYRSTDYGQTWSFIQNLGTETSVYSLVGLGNGILLAGTNPAAKIYKSIDAGLSWNLVYTAAGEQFIYTLNTWGSGVVLAGTGQHAKIFRSVDYGATWGLIQALGSESSIRSFITLRNGATLAGSGENAQIWRSLNCAADLEMIHNLGFLPSTAAEPSAYFLLAQPKFDPFPVHLKYQSSDYIRINLVQGGIYDFFCAQVTEIFDLSQKRLPYRMEITQTPWLAGTPVGNLPGTIMQVASYTPLVTANFDDILTVYDNNLQAAKDRLDDHHHGAQTYIFTEKSVPEDDDLFPLIDSDTVTHLTRKISWADMVAAIGVAGFPEAPIDGNTYGRKNAAWSQTLVDAPSDGNTYGRKNAALSQVTAAVRELLTPDRTYYVRTDGNDANTGLVNNSGGAFLTIQRAVNIASYLDNGGYNVTIQVVDGTYSLTSNVLCRTFLGSGLLIIQGNTTTPANCVLNFSNSSGFYIDGVL